MNNTIKNPNFIPITDSFVEWVKNTKEYMKKKMVSLNYTHFYILDDGEYNRFQPGFIYSELDDINEMIPYICERHGCNIKKTKILFFSCLELENIYKIEFDDDIIVTQNYKEIE